LIALKSGSCRGIFAPFAEEPRWKGVMTEEWYIYLNKNSEERNRYYELLLLPLINNHLYGKYGHMDT